MATGASRLPAKFPQKMKTYNINFLRQLETTYASTAHEHFIDFFKHHDYKNDTKMVVAKDLKSVLDIEATYSGVGFYVILTDYQASVNNCTNSIDGLKAIYRGHCATVKKRLMSHLVNGHYRANLPEKGVRYDVCLKLDDVNGIDITRLPYSSYRWRVVVHKMVGSSKLMREQAEHAFDEVFGRPFGSKEKGIRKRIDTAHRPQ
jgi:hypothetical protein